MQAAAAEMQSEDDVVDLTLSDGGSDSEEEDSEDDDEEEREKDADFFVCGAEEEEQEGLDDKSFSDIMALDTEESATTIDDKSGFKGAVHLQTVIEKYENAFARGLAHKRTHDQLSQKTQEVTSFCSTSSAFGSDSEAEEVRHVRCKIECIHT